jgi:hypothetical protein
MGAEPDETHKIIQTALEALRGGDKAGAQRLAQQATLQAPESESAWLILAAMASPAESLAYIRKALELNPESKAARGALDWALGRQRLQAGESGPEPAQEAIPQANEPDVEPSQEEIVQEIAREAEPPLEPIAQVIAPEVEPPQEELPQVIPPEREPAQEQIELPPDPPRPTGSRISTAQASAAARKTKRTSRSSGRFVLFSLLGLVVIALIAGLILLRPQLTGLWARLFSGKGCRPSLVIDTRSFEIRTIKPGSDGSINVPHDQPKRAYWVEGTDTNLVFGLSAVPDNLTQASSLKPGATAKVTWANCNSETYTLASPAQGLPDNATLLDQSTSQITIFIPGGTTSRGIAILGELQEETITHFNTPDASALLAEISLLGITTAPDGGTITVGISVYNYGQTSITLATSDVSLTSGNGSAMAPLNSEPALPKGIAPGATETFNFTFTHPGAQGATLKVVSVEYELEGY